MTYKFKKGSEIEVWSNRDTPRGSWCCAQILSGNGHTYSVTYFPYTSTGDVERVSRKAIRPLPPVKVLNSWVPGDTVEVFDKSSWKTAEVTSLDGNEYYLVRFLGSSMAVRAHVSGLRFRQSWQDGRWVMIGKNCKKPTNHTSNRLPTQGNSGYPMRRPFTEVKEHSVENNVPFVYGNDFQEHYQGLPRCIKKRTRYEPRPVGVRKMRAVEEGRRCERLVTGNIPKLLKMVDAVASPRTMPGGRYMHASSTNRRTRAIEEILPKVESSDTESISSSVGSCSTHSSPYRYYPTVGLYEDMVNEGSPDYAETAPLSESEPPPPTKEEVRAEIHQLELHAYRTTLSALHASGPISWEQETLISNLRLMLNISTDEHLSEIRSLIAVDHNARYR